MSAVLLATVAGTYAASSRLTGIEIWTVAGLGALGGLLVLPLVILSVKLVLLCLTLTMVGAIFWLLYRLLVE